MTAGNGVIAYWIVSSLLYLYMIGAAIEFGAGALAAWLRRNRTPGLAEQVHRNFLAWMSPVWETTNVFLVGFVVALIAFFPTSIPLYGQRLLYPAALGLGMLIMRGVLFTILYQRREERLAAVQTLFALTSLLVPVFWVAFFAVSLGVGTAQPLWASPVYWSLVWLALATPLQLGGAFLAWYGRPSPAIGATRADAARLPFASSLLARLAALGGTAAVLGQIALLLLSRAALPRYGQALLSPGPFVGWLVGWGMLVVAAAQLGRAAQYRPEPPAAADSPASPAQVRGARRSQRTAGVSLLLTVVGNLLLLVVYGVAHLPYLVEAATVSSSLSVQQAVVNATTYRSLLWVLGVGGVLILPALILLYVLFLTPRRPGQPGVGPAPGPGY